MPLIILIIELAAIWLVTFLLGFANAIDPPLWLLSIIIIVVDRTVTHITEMATALRKRAA